MLTHATAPKPEYAADGIIDAVKIISIIEQTRHTIAMFAMIYLRRHHEIYLNDHGEAA